MADILQKQYVKVFSDPNAEIPEEVLGKRIPKICIEDFVFTEEDIEKAIDELQTHAASGPDNFPAIVLKKCKQNLSRPLYHLWRKSVKKKGSYIGHRTLGFLEKVKTTV